MIHLMHPTLTHVGHIADDSRRGEPGQIGDRDGGPGGAEGIRGGRPARAHDDGDVVLGLEGGVQVGGRDGGELGGIESGGGLHGWGRYFILDQGGNPATTTGSGPEFGTVDKSGNIFAGEPRPRVLRKYVKVR